jgi:predicted phage gp36 major capsid-like protein
VSALSEHLDDDVLREALVEAVESCRSVVEAQRAELRSRLEAAEAALRDYDAKPRRRAAH